MASLVDIAIHEKSRGPIERRDRSAVTREGGLEGDFRGTRSERQVVVLSREAWAAACADLGEELPWTTRRGNLLVEGVELSETTGRRLRIGGVLLEITGECDPCARMDAERDGLRRALTPDWRAGVMCRVVEPGEVALGDAVALEAAG